MLRFLALAAVAIGTNTCIADEAQDQAGAFAKMYGSLCLQNLPDLQALRDKLAPMPKLPPDQAALFLSNAAGDAWPVPDKRGTFVLALPTGKNLCAVYARRADTDSAASLFTTLVASPPPPFVVKRVRDESKQTAVNGMTHTVSYEWSVPNSARKMLFTLTTAPSPTASIQALGTAAIVGP